MAYVPVPGRRYLNTRTGEVISRRQYDNARARAAGFRNRYELEQVRQDLRGSKWVGDIVANGHRPTFRDYRAIDNVRSRRHERAELYGEKRARQTEKNDPVLSDPNGDLAYLLDRAGYRPLSNDRVGGS